MVKTLIAACSVLGVIGVSMAGECYTSSYYPATQTYYSPEYSYTYYPAGNYGGYYYRAGYYRYYGGNWYLKGYGVYYPQSVYPTLYLPTTYRTAFFGTYVPPDVAQAYGAAYSASLTTTTKTQTIQGGVASGTTGVVGVTTSGSSSSSPENSATMARMLTLVEQIAVDVQGTKAKVSVIETEIAYLKKRVSDLESGKTNLNPSGPAPPIPSGEKEKPVTPPMPVIPREETKPYAPRKTGSISPEAFAEVKASCANCHTRGNLHKDTKFVMFNASGQLLLMSAEAKSKMLERIVEGTMPPKNARQFTAKGRTAVLAWLAESALLERRRSQVSSPRR